MRRIYYYYPIINLALEEHEDIILKRSSNSVFLWLKIYLVLRVLPNPKIMMNASWIIV